MKTSAVLRCLRFGPVSLLILISFAFNSHAQNATQHYKQTNLVSNQPGMAPVTDPNLVNPWGIVFAPGAPVWVANNRTQTSTLYDGTGLRQALVVNIPAGLNGAADPTGIVANGTVIVSITPSCSLHAPVPPGA